MGERTTLETLLHSSRADSETVDELFKLILGRPINNDRYKADVDNLHSVHYWIGRLVNSSEFKTRYLKRVGAKVRSEEYIADSEYRSPRLTPIEIPNQVLITGSCLSEYWARALQAKYSDVMIKHVLFNNASELEDISTEQLKKFPFQIAQIALRAIVREVEYFHTPGQPNGMPSEEALLQLCVKRLEANFNALMKYKRQMCIPVFILNFATPQANPLGFLTPRYQISNFLHLVERINQALVDLIEREGGVYLIDYDAICSTLGKRYINDDMSSHINHGSFFGATHWPEDIDLTPYGSVEEIYQPKPQEAVLALFNECISCYHAIAPTSKIKVVVFDLDGTLWRGVPAESDDIAPSRISEGWPLSIVEAAAFLKRRGILLAIASNNDPDAGRKIWDQVYGTRLPLSHFASVKISWDGKIKNVGDILREVNLLPENCLFVDDNPVEREQVAAAFPGISVIKGPISTWKRSLLWSAELQTPFITAESLTRTESTQKMIQRESLQAEMSHEEFLSHLNVKVEIDPISDVEDKKFARAFELLNKTNQFNTTGKRWTKIDFLEFFSSGGTLYAATVSDRLSDYGLTALLIANRQFCHQLVMSCRVFGLRVEHELFDHFLGRAPAGESPKIAFKPTGKNGPSAKFLTSIGVALAGSEGDEIEFHFVPSKSMTNPPQL